MSHPWLRAGHQPLTGAIHHDYTSVCAPARCVTCSAGSKIRPRAEIGKCILVKKFKRIIIFIIWDIIPVHFILSLVNPSRFEKSKPSTISVWLIGIYTAMFTIASQSYESALNRSKTRLDNISNVKEQQIRLNLISEIQNSKIPIEPKYQNFLKTIKSFFGQKELNSDLLQTTKLLLVNEKDSIVQVKIKDIDFSGIDFKSTVFKNAYFKNSKFINCAFNNCIFIHSQFYESDLSGAWINDCKMGYLNLKGSNLKLFQCAGTNLKCADFRSTNLSRSYFDCCILDSANFAFSTLMNCNFSQSNILKVQSFYSASIDSTLLNTIRDKIPTALERKTLNWDNN